MNRFTRRNLRGIFAKSSTYISTIMQMQFFVGVNSNYRKIKIFDVMHITSGIFPIWGVFCSYEIWGCIFAPFLVEKSYNITHFSLCKMAQEEHSPRWIFWRRTTNRLLWTFATDTLAKAYNHSFQPQKIEQHHHASPQLEWPILRPCTFKMVDTEVLNYVVTENLMQWISYSRDYGVF